MSRFFRVPVSFMGWCFGCKNSLLGQQTDDGLLFRGIFFDFQDIFIAARDMEEEGKGANFAAVYCNKTIVHETVLFNPVAVALRPLRVREGAGGPPGAGG